MRFERELVGFLSIYHQVDSRAGGHVGGDLHLNLMRLGSVRPLSPRVDLGGLNASKKNLASHSAEINTSHHHMTAYWCSSYIRPAKSKK
jgi:hypothetical protein